MAAIINSNVQSLTAQRNLSTSQASLAQSMQRLSSGLRINSAKDDAAGLAISERMSTQIRGLNQAGRNAMDGVSLAQTAEGALGTIGNNLQRIRELAVQSRNATNSVEDRAALQKEVTQLKNEVDRVAKETAFNGTNLLDGSFTSKAFQVGANQGQRINIDSIQNSQIGQLGSWSSVDKPALAYGGAMGGGETANTAGRFNVTALALGDLAGQSGAAIAGFKVSVGGMELDVAGVAASTGRDVADAQAAVATNIAAAVTAANIPGLAVVANGAAVEFTNNSLNAYALSTTGGVTTVDIGAGSNHVALTGATLQINGKNIEVAAAYTNADRTNQLVAAINNAFVNDGAVKASNVNGVLSLRSDQDIVIDAAPASGVGLTAGTIATVKGSAQTGFAGVSVTTAEGADDTIIAMDAALKAVNSARADLGAIQNRFESVVSNLAVNSENLSASRSRILDADFAAETANLSRSQILQQAGTAMVAQANQLPQGVLALLR